MEAKDMGITTRYLYYILAGTRNPTPKVARRLEEVTGVAKEVWIFGTGPERRAAWKKAKEEAKP